MDYYCAGYWNLSSFHKVFPRFFIPSYSEFDSFFLFFQAVIRGICRLDFRVNIWIWDRFYHLMILIPHLSILILFLFAFFEGISGQPRLPSTYLKINQNHFVDLPPPSILLWFLIRKFSGKSRLFFITHFFSKTKLYQNATSWPMPNMRFSENQRMVTFFLVANLDHDNLICYAFFRIFPGFQRKILSLQFLEYRFQMYVVMICFWSRFASLSHDNRLFKVILNFLVHSWKSDSRVQTSLDNKSMFCVSANFRFSGDIELIQLKAYEQPDQVTKPPRL